MLIISLLLKTDRVDTSRGVNCFTIAGKFGTFFLGPHLLLRYADHPTNGISTERKEIWPTKHKVTNFFWRFFFFYIFWALALRVSRSRSEQALSQLHQQLSVGKPVGFFYLRCSLLTTLCSALQHIWPFHSSWIFYFSTVKLWKSRKKVMHIWCKKKSNQKKNNQAATASLLLVFGYVRIKLLSFSIKKKDG